MNDWFNLRGRQDGRRVDWKRLRLQADAWLDSNLATTWQSARERYDASSSLFAKMRLSGWKRGATELMSEGLTLLCGGLLALYALAIPAFVEFDESKIYAGKFAVKFLDRYGNEIGKRGILHNDQVPLEELPDHLIKATLATEDRRFFDHFGVDFIGTARAFVTNVNAGETVQGGSTLTQQLAKNLFLTNERSFQRKIKEVFLSFLLESRFTKREIMKMYLDRAYMGGGAFGVEAAAQFYFGKSARDVTLAEAAMMAGLFKAPTKYAPHVNINAARNRAGDVLSNLVEAGYMTAGQVHQARLNPAKPVENRTMQSPDWFLDWAFDEVQKLADGRGVYSLVARTTIDVTTQQQAEEALLSTIRQYGRSHNTSSGALVSMEPDGAVRAIVGGLDYGESQFNRATMGRRQPGSSFKLYVYAAALENGFSSKTSVTDSAPSACGPRGWQPKNYDGGGGSGRSLTLQDAFKTSLNTVATDLSLYKMGRDSRDKVVEMTQRLGVPGIKKTCSMALGDGGITPLENTAAYAVFANGGKQVRPYAVLELFTTRGDLIYSHEKDEPPAPQIVRPRVVEQMNQMMQAVVTEGTGKRATLEFTHAAGKTGTSSSYRDAWFMGFSGALVTGVWLGNDDFMKQMLIRPEARSGSASGVTGGGLPAQTWNAFMSVAHQSMNIPTIPGLSPHPRQVQETQRLAELKRTDPALAAAQSQAGARSNKVMPDLTREALRKLADLMRRSAGSGAASEKPAEAAPAAAPAAPTQPGSDRRADIQTAPAAVTPR